MTLETFFEKFDTFADAPNAVARMRELVLQLAVTGKLCHNEEVKWQEGVLGDVIELISGQHLLAHEHNAAGRGIPYLTGPSDFGDKSPIPTRWTDQPKVTAEPGDILITVKGSGVGKTNVLVEQTTAISRQLMALRVVGANPEFIHLVLKRAAEHFQNEKTGIAIPGIGRREVLGLQIVLPPLAEQKRIVAKVDELMALCDRLEAQQQERDTGHAGLARASLARFADAPTPKNLNFLFHKSFHIPPADLRKSILTLAVQGKLVPQHPKEEPAEMTFHGLKPIEPEFSKGQITPSQWAWSAYRNLTTLVTSGSRGWKEFYAENGSIFVRTQNIKTDTLILDDVAFVDLPKSAEGMRAQVLKGDILITITGANVTKAARIEEQIPEAYVSQHIALTRPRWSDMSEWLHLCFISHGSARGALEQLAYGDKPGLNLNNIRDLILPLPPLAEQHRIVAKVDQLMALVDELETQLATSRATAKNLLEALVAELTAV
jgi:type I restriction enzyme, S subunit